MPLQPLFFFFFNLISMDSRFCATGGKRLLGRCAAAVISSRAFTAEPCLQPAGPLTQQQQQLGLRPGRASFGLSDRTCQLVSCRSGLLLLCLCQLIAALLASILEAARTPLSARAALCSASVSQHSILLPDSQSSDAVCAAPTICRAPLFI